jgi:hypothetical protein
MASFTQLRISQLSGSIGSSAGQINDKLHPMLSSSMSGSHMGASLSDHLSHVVSAIQRVHGATAFSNAVAGTFYSDLKSDSAGNIDLGSTTDADKFGTVFVANSGGLKIGNAEEHTIMDNNSSGGLEIDSTEAIAIESSGGAISVGADAVAQAINIGTGAAARTITMGNVSGATALALNAGTGGVAVASTGTGDITLDSDDTMLLDADGVLELNSSAGAISVGNDAVAAKISVGGDTSTRTEVEVNAVLLDLNAGSGGLTMDAAGASNLTTSSGVLTLDGAGGVSIAGNAAEVDITTTGALDLNGAAVTIDASTGLSLQGAAASDLTLGAASSGDVALTIAATNSGGGKGNIDMDADGEILIDAAEGMSLDAGLASNFTTAAGALTLDGAGGVSIVGNAAEVDITTTGALDLNSGAMTLDASTISLDGSGALNIDTSDTSSGITLGTATSAVPISIGHATSEVTIGDNLTVTGDLTVSGVTTTLDTTNLLVEDPIVVLNKANSSANGQGGIAIELGGSSLDMVFGRVANDTWGVGTKDTSGGTVTTVADMTLGALRAGKLEIDGSTEHIDVSSSTMTLTAGAGITLDAATDIVLDADGGNIYLKDGGTTGLDIDLSHGHVILSGSVSDKDIIFAVNDGGTTTEVARFDGSESSFLMSSSKKIMLGAAEEYVYGDGTDIHFGVGSGGDVNLPSSIGLTFGDDGEKIEGDGSGLTIAGGSLTLDSEADINIDAGGADIIFKDDGTEFGRIIKSSSNMLLSGAIGDIVLDPAGGNVVPSADSADSLGSDAVSASHSAGSSQSGLTSGLTSGQSFSMSGNNVAILYGSSLSAPSGGSGPSGFASAVGSSVSLSSFSSTINGTLSISNSYSGSTISAGTILSLNGSSSSFYFVVLADYSGGSSMSICAMSNVSGHSTSIGSVSSVSSYSSAGFSGSGAISGVSVSADDVVAYTFSGGTAIFEAVTAITSSTPWGFVANPNADVSGLSTFSSSGSPSSVTSGGTITAAASVVAWANIFVDNVDLNGQGKVYLDADQNMKIEPVSSTGVKITGNIDNAASVHLVGYGMTFDGGDQNDSFLFNNSAIALEAITAPSSTTGKLYNVTGSLVWNGSVITPRSQKISYTVTASHPSNVHTGLVIAGLSHDRGVNSLNSDVFLNGQLMLSGATSAAGDYILSGSVSALAFHFGLEADDVVTVVTLG